MWFLYKLLKNKFRANKLIKYLFEDSPLLQLKLTLFKELTLSLSKKNTNVGSNLIYFKELKKLNDFLKVRPMHIAYSELHHLNFLYL